MQHVIRMKTTGAVPSWAASLADWRAWSNAALELDPDEIGIVARTRSSLRTTTSNRMQNGTASGIEGCVERQAQFHYSNTLSLRLASALPDFQLSKRLEQGRPNHHQYPQRHRYETLSHARNQNHRYLMTRRFLQTIPINEDEVCRRRPII